MILTKRIILGVVVGLVIAGLLFIVIGSAISDNLVLFVITGVLIGLFYAGAFSSRSVDYLDGLIRGFTIGIISWIVLALNVYPALMGQGPMWNITAVESQFPHLIAYLLTGSLVGLLYSFAYSLVAKPFGLLASEPSPAAITTRVVIIGGGYAGVSAAQTLEKEMVDDPSVGIWLVSQTNYLLHTPMLSEVSASAVDAQHISPSLRSFFQRVQVVQGSVQSIDMSQRIVHLTADNRSHHQEIAFDHLILSAGGVPNFFGNKGVESQAFTFKSLDDAVLLRNQIIDMFERADIEPNADRRRRMLTFVVAGGGFAGVELIGGLNDFARGIQSFYPNIPPEEIRLVLVHSREIILPELSQSLGKFAQSKLEERGVEFKLGVRVTGAEPSAVMLGEESLPTETFVWTAGNKPSPILASLNLPLTERGQIEVDAMLKVPNSANVWAAGDCAQVPDPATGKSCPPTAQHGLRQGKLAGHNVAASIKGKPLKSFNFKGLGSLAALGHQLAVAEIMGYRFSGFLAWMMWRFIYLSKLPTFQKQVRVGLDWLLDVFFPPDITQTIDFSRPDMEKTK